MARLDSSRRQEPCYLLRKVALGQLEALLSRFVVTGFGKPHTVGGGRAAFKTETVPVGSLCHLPLRSVKSPGSV